MSKIALLGADGQLGSDLYLEFSRAGHEVCPLIYPDLAIEDGPKVEEVLGALDPDIVVNATAFNDVEGAEDHPGPAYAVNSKGVSNLARYSAKKDIVMVHFSTDYVFGKNPPKAKGGYTEFDRPGALSLYGASKLSGEEALKKSGARFILVRTSWLFGARARPESHRNFVLKIIDLAKNRESLLVVDDQIGSPTYSLDLAKSVLALLATEHYGLWHFSGAGQCSWFDLARRALLRAGIEIPVKPCSSDMFPQKARRPSFSVLTDFKAGLLGLDPLPCWEEGLDAYIDRLKQEGLI